MIQTANASLVNALITAAEGQQGFKTIENHPAYKAHQDAYTLIPKVQILEYYKHAFHTSLLRSLKCLHPK